MAVTNLGPVRNPFRTIDKSDVIHRCRCEYRICRWGWGCQPIILVTFSRQLHENEKKITREGLLDPPIRWIKSYLVLHLFIKISNPSTGSLAEWYIWCVFSWISFVLGMLDFVGRPWLAEHPVSVMRQTPVEIDSSFENDCHIRTIFLVVNRLWAF